MPPRFIEVSHVIEPGMVTYPGLPPPVAEVIVEHPDASVMVTEKLPAGRLVRGFEPKPGWLPQSKVSAPLPPEAVTEICPELAPQVVAVAVAVAVGPAAEGKTVAVAVAVQFAFWETVTV